MRLSLDNLNISSNAYYLKFSFFLLLKTHFSDPIESRDQSQGELLAPNLLVGAEPSDSTLRPQSTVSENIISEHDRADSRLNFPTY